jgi:hypothetical protein
MLEFGLGGLDVEAVGLRVQRRQHLLRPHGIALVDAHFADAAADLKAERGRVLCLDQAEETADLAFGHLGHGKSFNRTHLLRHGGRFLPAASYVRGEGKPYAKPKGERPHNAVVNHAHRRYRRLRMRSFS